MTNKPKEEKQLDYSQRSLRKYHPYKLMMSFALIGIGTLFLVLMISFLISQEQGAWSTVPFPKAFIVSTVVIGLSSFTIYQAKVAFQNEHRRLFMWYVMATAVMGLAFLGSQFFGWHALKTSGFDINTNNGASYLYLISGLHAIHLVAGLIGMGIFSFAAIKYNKHLGTSIFYFTDPVRRLHLDLMSMYWHFLGGVWILLVVFFLLNTIGV